MVAKLSGFIFTVFLGLCSVLLYLDIYISDPTVVSPTVLRYAHRKEYRIPTGSLHNKRRPVSTTLERKSSIHKEENNYNLNSVPQITVSKHQQQSMPNDSDSLDEIINEFQLRSEADDSISWMETRAEILEYGLSKLHQETPKPIYSFMDDLNEMDDYIREINNSKSGQSIMSVDYSFMHKLQEMEEHRHQVHSGHNGDDDVDELLHLYVNNKNYEIARTSKPFQPKQKSNSKLAERTGNKKTRSFAHIPVNLTDVKRRYSKAKRSDIPEELYRLAPDVFDQVPPPEAFVQEFKSPCWHRDSDLQCLPYFYLAGMPKCGTSDVWAKMNSHNGVFAIRKEPHWWTRARIGEFGSASAMKPNKNGVVPLREYIGRYAGLADMQDSFRTVAYIAGDGSASTFWDNHAWEMYYPEYYNEGPPYVIGDVIHAVSPGVKIIVMFRNPMERLYSSYLYFWRDKEPSKSKFHQLVVSAVSSLNLCLQSRSMRACTYSNTKGTNEDRIGLALGFYDVFVKDWLRSFPREQLLLIRLEDWSKNCKRLMPRIFNFLKLGPLKSSSIVSLCGMKKAQNKGPRGKGSMLAKTRQLLEFVYKPHLENMAELLEDVKWLWPQP